MFQRMAEAIGANRTVLTLSMARLADALGNSVLFVLIPLYVGAVSTSLPLPKTVLVGILISVFGLVSAGVQPFVGARIDRSGRRKPYIVGGLGVMAAAILCFVGANRFWELLLIRGVQGFGVALTIPAALALMAAASEHHTRGGSMGIYTTFRMGGIAAGPILGGWIHDRWGFTPAFAVSAGLVVVGMMAVHLWVPEVGGHGESDSESVEAGAEPTRSDGDPPEEGQGRAGSGARSEVQEKLRVLDLRLLGPGLLGTTFSVFAMALTITMIATLEKQFNQRLQATALGFSVAFSAVMVSRLIFQEPFGWLSDHVGRKPVVIAGLVLLAPSTAFLGLVHTTVQLTIWRLVQGVGSAAVAAPAFALAADLATEGGQGRQMSAVTTGFFLGLAVGPLLTGVLALPFFELPFLVAGAVTLVAAAVVLIWVPETVGG